MKAQRRDPDMGRTHLAGSLAASAVAGVLIFLLLVATAPDAVPFSPNNYGWNGIQQVASSFQFRPVGAPPRQNGSATTTTAIDSSSVLLILQPVLPFDNADAAAILDFVRGGGMLIVSDSSGVSNPLLRQLGLKVSINPRLMIRDDTYNWRGTSFPIALTPRDSPLFGQVGGIALDAPSPLTVSPGSGAKVVASTSPVSVAIQRTGDQVRASTGPFSVVISESIGKGSVIVISDSYFLTNGVWKNANNQLFIRRLLSNSTVYLDTSHWPPNTIASIRGNLATGYAFMSSIPRRYLLTFAFVVVGLSLVPLFSAPRADDGKKETSEEEETSQENLMSEEDSILLRRVRKDRQRYGLAPDG